MNAPRFAAGTLGKLIIAGAVVAALGAAAMGTARADDDHWHHGDWHGDWHPGWGYYHPRGYYYGPPAVVYAPPPPVVYAPPPPPPAYYAPPPPVVYTPAPSLNVVVPLHIR